MCNPCSPGYPSQGEEQAEIVQPVLSCVQKTCTPKNKTHYTFASSSLTGSRLRSSKQKLFNLAKGYDPTFAPSIGSLLYLMYGTFTSVVCSDPASFTESSFWAKVKSSVKKAGSKVIYHALLLYYAMIAPGTTAIAKSIILAALVYFISPVDVIPDWIIGTGFMDDLAVLVGAVSAVSGFISAAVKERASKKMAEWTPSSHAENESVA